LIHTKKIPIGSPVIIDTVNSKYNFKNEKYKEIALMPEGIVNSYSKDGSKEFLIVQLRSNIKIKVTENELSECTKKLYSKDNSLQSNIFNKIKDFLNQDIILTGEKRVNFLINPVNFFKWIKYVIADIF
tara:strand:+ start:270 stop:656 length:387 start_codon:yes stop_codon:yes gene_type:complete